VGTCDRRQIAVFRLVLDARSSTLELIGESVMKKSVARHPPEGSFGRIAPMTSPSANSPHPRARADRNNSRCCKSPLVGLLTGLKMKPSKKHREPMLLLAVRVNGE
jgi:hypothetical protein